MCKPHAQTQATSFRRPAAQPSTTRSGEAPGAEVADGGGGEEKIVAFHDRIKEGKVDMVDRAILLDELATVDTRTQGASELLAALERIEVPMWFINGQYDQLRANERLFTRIASHAELIVVPRTTHLVTAMRPRVFNALLDLALATLENPDAGGSSRTW